MPQLQLYKVGSNGRVALGQLAADGDFYTADKQDDGTIVLSPVNVVTTTSKRTTDTPAAPASPDGATPWAGDTTTDI